MVHGKTGTMRKSTFVCRESCNCVNREAWDVLDENCDSPFDYKLSTFKKKKLSNPKIMHGVHVMEIAGTRHQHWNLARIIPCKLFFFYLRNFFSLVVMAQTKHLTKYWFPSSKLHSISWSASRRWAISTAQLVRYGQQHPDRTASDQSCANQTFLGQVIRSDGVEGFVITDKLLLLVAIT